MNDKQVINKGEATDRRTLLKGIVAGSAVVTGSKTLPENWVKPISNAVVLPSHANTTQNDYVGYDGLRGGDYYEYVDPSEDNDGTDYDDYRAGDAEEYTEGDHDYGEDDHGSDDNGISDDYENL